MTALLKTKCVISGLQSVICCALQSVTKCITKWVKDYKLCHGGLQSVTGVTKCDGITKCGGIYCLLFDKINVLFEKYLSKGAKVDICHNKKKYV